MTALAPNGRELDTTVRVESLSLPHPFQFAHATIKTVDIVRLDIAGQGERGRGEIATGIDESHDTDAIAAEARELATLVSEYVSDDVSRLLAALRENAGRASGPARMLVEMACLDFAARRARTPVWRFLRLPGPAVVRLVRTVPLDEDVPDGQRPVKIKLGGVDDDRVLRRLAGVPGPILLDVNRAWSAADWHRLRPLVAAVAPAVLEDPVDTPDLLPDIKAALPGTAVLLDEEVTCLADIERAAAVADGANVKLMRFGGLLPAIEALGLLRSAGAATMLGCYLEPPRAIAYAAQLAGQCDWTDLDGHFWLTGDPAVMSYELDSSEPGIPRITYDG